MDDSPETAAFLPHKPGKREKLGPRPPLPPATFISLTLLCLVSCGWAAVWMALLIVLLPKQVGDMDGVGNARKGAALGTVLLFAGIVSIFEPPFVGWLSDRTRTRYGRRRPWIVLGTIGMCGGMLCLPYCEKLSTLIGVFTCIQFFSNFSSTAFLAMLPDVVPADQLGVASGFFAASCAFGQIIGAGSGALTSTVGLPHSYLFLVLFFLATLIGTVLSTPEDPRLGDYDDEGSGEDGEGNDGLEAMRPGCCERMHAAGLIYLGSLVDNTDFRWVWATRFLMNCGIAIVQGFLQCVFNKVGENIMSFRQFSHFSFLFFCFSSSAVLLFFFHSDTLSRIGYLSPGGIPPPSSL